MTTELGLVVRASFPRRAKTLPGAALDVQLGAGLRGLVGTKEDGLLTLGALVAGLERPARSTVTVFGHDPRRDPRVRARVGATLHDPVLPDARTVQALLHDVDRVRASGAATFALSHFGLSSWATRRPSTLTRPERRALELIIALSTPSPLALLLTEPAADIAAVDRDLVQQALSAAARGGACVIVATASVADAVSLAPVVHLLERGRVSDAVSIDQMGTTAWPGAQSLRVEVDLPRLLVAALADDPAVTGFAWDHESQRTLVTLHGRDLEQLALAIAAAAAATGASIRSIVPLPPDLAEIRGRASGMALAAYYAGYYAYGAPQNTGEVAPNGTPGATA